MKKNCTKKTGREGIGRGEKKDAEMIRECEIRNQGKKKRERDKKDG